MAGILSDWIDATPWLPRVRSRAEELASAGLMIELGWVTVAEGTRIDGFLAREGEAVHALYLREAARGRGIGGRLLTEAQRQENRLTLWTYDANLGAQRFYARQGFREVSRTPGQNDEGLPDIQLCWERKAA